MPCRVAPWRDLVFGNGALADPRNAWRVARRIAPTLEDSGIRKTTARHVLAAGNSPMPSVNETRGASKQKIRRVNPTRPTWGRQPTALQKERRQCRHEAQHRRRICFRTFPQESSARRNRTTLPLRMPSPQFRQSSRHCAQGRCPLRDSCGHENGRGSATSPMRSSVSGLPSIRSFRAMPPTDRDCLSRVQC